ncbi:MAG: hypothetical protein ACPGSI_15295 [Pikeienuella sp.]
MSTYGNVTDLIAYQALRGTTVANDTATAASHQRASDYIRTRFAIRLGLAADDVAVIEATYIAAGYDLAAPGFWQKTFTPAEAKVLTQTGKIRWTPLAGRASGSDAQLPTSPAIEALFAGANTFGITGLVV